MPIYKQSKKKDGVNQYKVVVNYTDRDGKYRQKTKLVYGKEEATMAEMRLQFELNENTPSNEMTIGLLFEEYIQAKKHEIRGVTIEKNIRNIKNHIMPYLEKVKLKSLSTKTMQDWKNKIGDKPLKTKTKQNIYSALRALLNFAVKMDYISSNPLTKVGNFKEVEVFEMPEEKIQYYTAEEFKKFINYSKSQCVTYRDWCFYVFFNIAFFTGMRKGEIHALKWSDIRGNVIRVRRSLGQKRKGIPIDETSPKNTSSYRDLQMPRQLIEILNEHKKRQMESLTFTNDFRVCGGNKCLSDTSISNYNIKCADACGLHRIRIHDFRHTHATVLINENVNIQEIARRLGHEDVKETWKTYAHLYPREEEKAVKILEDLRF